MKHPPSLGATIRHPAGVRIRPLGDRVLVRPHPVPEWTSFGLYLPPIARGKPQRGTVLAVGPGNWDEAGKVRNPPDVEAGDVILYPRYTGAELKYGDEDQVILWAQDVLAVVDDDAEVVD